MRENKTIEKISSVLIDRKVMIAFFAVFIFLLIAGAIFQWMPFFTTALILLGIYAIIACALGFYHQQRADCMMQELTRELDRAYEESLRIHSQTKRK